MFAVLRRVNWTYIAYRAWKTAFYAAAPTVILIVRTQPGPFSDELLKTAAVAGGSAALSAIWNTLVKPKLLEVEAEAEAGESPAVIIAHLEAEADAPTPKTPDPVPAYKLAEQAEFTTPPAR